jgi:hypothetical protein
MLAARSQVKNMAQMLESVAKDRGFSHVHVVGPAYNLLIVRGTLGWLPTAANQPLRNYLIKVIVIKCHLHGPYFIAMLTASHLHATLLNGLCACR